MHLRADNLLSKLAGCPLVWGMAFWRILRPVRFILLIGIWGLGSWSMAAASDSGLSAMEAFSYDAIEKPYWEKFKAHAADEAAATQLVEAYLAMSKEWLDRYQITYRAHPAGFKSALEILGGEHLSAPVKRLLDAGYQVLVSPGCNWSQRTGFFVEFAPPRFHMTLHHIFDASLDDVPVAHFWYVTLQVVAQKKPHFLLGNFVEISSSDKQALVLLSQRKDLGDGRGQRFFQLTTLLGDLAQTAQVVRNWQQFKIRNTLRQYTKIFQRKKLSVRSQYLKTLGHFLATQQALQNLRDDLNLPDTRSYFNHITLKVHRFSQEENIKELTFYTSFQERPNAYYYFWPVFEPMPAEDDPGYAAWEAKYYTQAWRWIGQSAFYAKLGVQELWRIFGLFYHPEHWTEDDVQQVVTTLERLIQQADVVDQQFPAVKSKEHLLVAAVQQHLSLAPTFLRQASDKVAAAKEKIRRLTHCAESLVR